MNWNLLNIPYPLISLPQWVCVKAGSKIPMQAQQREAASSTNPTTWASFGEATRAIEKGWYDGVGFVFNDNGIIGIDIDDGFKAPGELSDIAKDILPCCASYTERSRSGRGFHVLLRGQLPFAGKNNLKGVEIYKTGRYFIMTGDIVRECRTIQENQVAVDGILSRYFTETMRVSPETTKVFSTVFTAMTGPIVRAGKYPYDLCTLPSSPEAETYR